MKTMWERPYTHVEGFVANEYCTSVCFALACTSGPDGNGTNLPNHYTAANVWNGYWENEKYDPQYTHTGSCTVSSNNYVRIEDNAEGGKDFVLLEKSSDQGWLHGVVTSQYDIAGEKDENGKEVADGRFGTGDFFGWVTLANNDNRVWFHWAIAGADDRNAPKRLS